MIRARAEAGRTAMRRRCEPGGSIRRLPTVTEVCVFYRRQLTFRGPDGTTVRGRDWIRSEWKRTGLQLQLANTACGVVAAATRGYMSQNSHWQFPPAERMERIVAYANEHGRPEGRPYYSLDGRRPATRGEWKNLRHHWTHAYGLTNVWSHPPVHGPERRRPGRRTNQKPVALMRRIIDAASSPGDTVWEPFGGLCSASVAAIETGRHAFAAESRADVATLARHRLTAAAARPHPARETAPSNPRGNERLGKAAEESKKSAMPRKLRGRRQTAPSRVIRINIVEQNGVRVLESSRQGRRRRNDSDAEAARATPSSRTKTRKPSSEHEGGDDIEQAI